MSSRRFPKSSRQRLNHEARNSSQIATTTSMKQTAVTSVRKSFLQPVAATRNVTVRKSVYDLSAAEALALRKAFAALQAISDNRGYQYVAGIHGLNQYLCPHGSPMFLVWHRPYV